MRPGIKPGADEKRREGEKGKIAIRKYITPLRICFLRGDIRAVFGSRIETGMNRQDAKEGGEGEELLFYPQMTQIFFWGGTYGKLKFELRTMPPSTMSTPSTAAERQKR